MFAMIPVAWAASVKISEMPSAGSLGATDTFPVVQTGVNKKATINLITGGLSAAELLAKIKTVDGTGSGLDADTVDGMHAAAFRNHSTVYAQEQGLRVVRGVVFANGSTASGSGFTSSKASLGVYLLTFIPSFSSAPTAVITFRGNASCFAVTDVETVSSLYITAQCPFILTPYLSDASFSFIAIGPR